MSDGSSRFAGLNVAKIISRPLSANPLTAEPLTALRVGADSEVYVPKGDPDFIASDYIYWPLDDAEGLVPTKFSNVEGAPDFTFSSESGLWSSGVGPWLVVRQGRAQGRAWPLRTCSTWPH